MPVFVLSDQTTILIWADTAAIFRLADRTATYTRLDTAVMFRLEH